MAGQHVEAIVASDDEIVDWRPLGHEFVGGAGNLGIVDAEVESQVGLWIEVDQECA